MNHTSTSIQRQCPANCPPRAIINSLPILCQSSCKSHANRLSMDQQSTLNPLSMPYANCLQIPRQSTINPHLSALQLPMHHQTTINYQWTIYPPSNCFPNNHESPTNQLPTIIYHQFNIESFINS